MDLLVYPLYIVADRADHHARQLGGRAMGQNLSSDR